MRNEMTQTNRGRVHSVNASDKRGCGKKPVGAGVLTAGLGLEGDAHAVSKTGDAGDNKRQVSILAIESVRKLATDGNVNAIPGDFAENITTEGIDWGKAAPGSIIAVGEARLLVTGIGKPEHGPGDYSFHGKALLAKEGVFAKVTEGGQIKPGDEIAIIDK